LPWLLAGATASAVLASSVAGDARSTDRSQRAIDAIFLGGALALAVGWAALLQYALTEKLEGKPWDLGDVISLGLAGFACGAVIGFKLPWACKTNLVTPPDRATASVLWELLVQAERELGSKVAAQNWIFSPNADLDGITPAEAIQYTTRATGVKRLLETEAAARREEARAERPMPVVIEGGRGAARLVASPA
jgi:hypothetical protein